MSGYLRRKRLIIRRQRIGTKQWETFSEGPLQPESLPHGSYDLTPFMPPQQQKVFASFLVHRYSLLFFFNTRVSASLWHIHAFGSLLSTTFLCVSPLFCPTTVWLMTLWVLNRGFDHVVHTSWTKYVPGHPINCWWATLIAWIQVPFPGSLNSSHGIRVTWFKV